MSTEYEGQLWSIRRWVSGFANNSYLITCKSSNQSIIIDTPDQPTELMDAAAGTDVKAILITHNHWDHLEGFDDVTERFPVPVGIGANDAPAVSARVGFRDPIDVSHDSVVQIGSITLRCIATPGHTPGSTCYLLPGENPGSPPHVFTGDTLFPGGPGRTPDASAFDSIIESITSQLLVLPANSIVMPGHGDFTTIAASQGEYDVFASKKRETGIFGDVTWE